MVVIHGTRKFLERVGPPTVTPAPTTTALGDWYATVLFWRPQVALFVNEVTLLPVLVPLAPARGVLSRFLSVLPRILLTHGCSATFVAAELEQMQYSVLDKTKSRSVLGIMNEFTYLAEAYTGGSPFVDLNALSVQLAGTPCGPLYKTFVSPDRALAAIAGAN